MAGLRAVAAVVAAVYIVAVSVFAVLSTPVDGIADANQTLLGSRETVRVMVPDGTALDGTALEGRATIDTGASRSSIDRRVADALSIDLRDAETVTVESALGREERPLVTVDLQIADTNHRAEVTVADRSGLADDILIGRDLLGDFLVTTGQTDLTSPGTSTAPGPVESLLAATTSPVEPGSLLALMPLGALTVVVARYVLGVSTLGTFTPVLLTLSFLQAGIVPSVVLTVGVIAVGLAVEPVLRRLRTPRVARLAMLIGVSSALLLALQEVGQLGDVGSWGAAFPLVVAAGLVERVYEVWTSDGLRDALTDTAVTLLVATAVTPLLLAPPVRMLAEQAPWALAVAAVIASGVVGSYRGLRLSELSRFRRAAEAVT